MQWVRILMAVRREKQLDKYISLLLGVRIRLEDVPRRFLRDVRICSPIYGAAFRVDQSLSKERYEEDMSFLTREMIAAQIEQRMCLHECLTRIYERMENDLLYHPEVFRW